MNPAEKKSLRKTLELIAEETNKEIEMAEQTNNGQKVEVVEDPEPEPFEVSPTEETGENDDQQPTWERSEAYDNR